MKTSRQSNSNYWLNFGKRAAASGFTLDAAIGGLKPEATGVRELIEQGFAAETKRRQKKPCPMCGHIKEPGQ